MVAFGQYRVADLFPIHARRGQAGMDAIGMLSKRTGLFNHDYWKAYLSYSQAKHGLCNVHFLRELTYLEENYQQIWAEHTQVAEGNQSGCANRQSCLTGDPFIRAVG